MRLLTAGESHGPACLAIVEGLPAGIKISAAQINAELAKRRSDYGRGGRAAIEKDDAEILSGVRYGRTLGSPISLMVRNLDFDNWRDVMSIEDAATPADKVTSPRPGHADLPGIQKYAQDDIRNISERASARETVSRVMAGAVAKQFLGALDIRIASHTVQIGAVRLERPAAFEEIAAVYESDPEIRCIDHAVSLKMRAAIDEARKRGDTLGGAVEAIAAGAPAGLGSVMHFDRRLDARLGAALMSIPSVKAVEIGEGIKSAGMPGSVALDAISLKDGRYVRATNRAGGIEGGMSNGADIVCRVYHKPVPTMGIPAQSVDIHTHQPAAAAKERADVCVVPRAGVIAEAMLALVLAETALEKFGGDHIKETKRNLSAYLKSVNSRR